jgi:dienelactone hydrolase
MQGFVSFHGGLDTPTPNDAKNIKAPVLVLHGAADPYAPKEQVDAMKKEFDTAKVKYEVVLYPGAVHAFTIKAAGNDASKGAAYNASADKKSWSKMQEFFKGIFKK